jgi:hypothetical protein
MTSRPRREPPVRIARRSNVPITDGLYGGWISPLWNQREVRTMPLINTDGLTIIGDGSQWFWAMAGFLAIPVTGYLIFSQLRGQRSANRVNAMKALSDEWNSERMVRHRLAVMLHPPEGSGSPPTLAFVANFFERMGYLAKRGDVHLEDIWENWGQAIQIWWMGTADAIAEERSRYGQLTWRNWEKLVHAMADLDRREGNRRVDLDVVIGAEKSVVIRELIERLRLEQDMKLGIVPTWTPDQAAVTTPG